MGDDSTKGITWLSVSVRRTSTIAFILMRLEGSFFRVFMLVSTWLLAGQKTLSVVSFGRKFWAFRCEFFIYHLKCNICAMEVHFNFFNIKKDVVKASEPKEVESDEVSDEQTMVMHKKIQLVNFEGAKTVRELNPWICGAESYQDIHVASSWSLATLKLVVASFVGSLHNPNAFALVNLRSGIPLSDDFYNEVLCGDSVYATLKPILK